MNAGINLVAPAQVQANTYNSFDDSSALFLRSGAEFMRFRKTEDDVLFSKDIDAPNIKSSSEVKTNVLNSNGLNDIVFKRNDVNKVSLTANDLITEANVNVVSQGQFKRDIYNSYGDDNVSFRRYGTEYLVLNSNPAPIVIPCVQVPDGIGFTCEKFFTNEIRCRNDNTNFAFYGGNSSGNGKVNYMTYRRSQEDIQFYRDVNISNGYTLDAATIVGNTLHSNFVYSDSFRCRNYNVDTPFLGGNITEDGRITFMTYRHLLEDVRFLRNILIDDGRN